MGKVKCEADAPIGTGFDVSIPYGKGKDNTNDRRNLAKIVSIPYGKGKV